MDCFIRTASAQLRVRVSHFLAQPFTLCRAHHQQKEPKRGVSLSDATSKKPCRRQPALHARKNVVRAGFRPNMRETERNLVTIGAWHSEMQHASIMNLLGILGQDLFPNFPHDFRDLLAAISTSCSTSMQSFSHISSMCSLSAERLHARWKSSLTGRWAVIQHPILVLVK